MKASFCLFFTLTVIAGVSVAGANSGGVCNCSGQFGGPNNCICSSQNVPSVQKRIPYNAVGLRQAVGKIPNNIRSGQSNGLVQERNLSKGVGLNRGLGSVQGRTLNFGVGSSQGLGLVQGRTSNYGIGPRQGPGSVQARTLNYGVGPRQSLGSVQARTLNYGVGPSQDLGSVQGRTSNFGVGPRQGRGSVQERTLNYGVGSGQDFESVEERVSGNGIDSSHGRGKIGCGFDRRTLEVRLQTLDQQIQQITNLLAAGYPDDSQPRPLQALKRKNAKRCCTRVS